MKINYLINKKKQGQSLDKKDTNFLVKEFTNQKISDNEMCEFLKTIHKSKIEDKEILNLFESTIKYSRKISFPQIPEFKIDKHSTGGIGDNTTIVLMPLLSALGLKIFKLSGKRLGHTGGTIDKMKIFSGIKLDYSIVDFQKDAEKFNILLASPIEEISLFEKKVYHLRTLTKTTKNVGLIVNSIMIKKILIENDALLIDIKIGKGSLFKNLSEVKHFCNLIKKIAEHYKRKYKIVYSNMNQPLGHAIGTKLEIFEAVEIMQGGGPEDLVELIVELASNALIMANKFQNLKDAKEKVLKVLNSGIVLEYFKKWIQFQGGDWKKVLNNRKINTKHKISVKATKLDYIWIPDASQIGKFLNHINLIDEFTIDNDSGIFWKHKNNSFVKKGDEILVFYTNKKNIDFFKKKVNKLFVINTRPKKKISTVLTSI